MKRTKAFTLIELLVVIAIISLLMSIIVPSIRRVKQQATGAVCLSNLRGLSACWHAYQADNNGEIVPGQVPNNNSARREDGVTYWIESPQDDDGNYMGAESDITLEYEQNGIREGSLFPYVEALDAYHCPGDKSSKMFEDNSNGTKPWFNSYSINGLMNGECALTGVYSESSNEYKHVVKKASRIISAGNKIVFMENTDERGWLIGSWLFDATYGSGDPAWNDPVAIWHRDRSSIGFADGHAELHQWVDDTTIENAEAGDGVNTTPAADESGDDVEFVNRSYIPGRR